MTTTAIVDRIESNIAVIEIEGQTYDLPVTCLPAEAREGDTLQIVTTVTKATDSKVASKRTSGPEVIDL